MADGNLISDHADIIRDALWDYRRWLDERDPSDKKLISEIDSALELLGEEISPETHP